MAEVVAPRRANLSVRGTRLLVSAVFGATQLLRRPPKPPGIVQEQKYGSDPAERIETIAARAAAPQRAPIVYIHGGGWIAGRKESYTRYLSVFANAGYSIFNVEYPLAPENPHPGILRSLLAALDWIHSNHPETTGFHVMGDSAGGNLAMMVGLLAANPPLVAAVDPQRSAALPLTCHSVVSLYGVLDRLSWLEDGFPGAENMLESYAGRAAFEPAVGPELAITPMDLEFEAVPPSFICAGTKDQLCRSSRIFAERLASGPGKVVHKEYPGEGHGFFNLGRTKSDVQLNADVLEFLEGVDPNVD
ncbi:MAG: hypothetical protein CL908_15210 [Deltaproteobacteria bacterium]|nr:hypothetical protein [Deltaproteobacteria bacterium]